MILSHLYKFIFIKTSKTAGTSIEIALSKFCGEKDVITPISPEDEKLRRKLGYRGPQNHTSPLMEYGVRDVVKYLVQGKKKRRFHNHISAKSIRRCVGESVWSSYYKFCFERNPWDRILSDYYWRYQSEPRPTIAEFLESDGPLVLKKKGFELYTLDGKIVVDRVCLYENLVEELERTRLLLGIPEKLDLPHAKSGFRNDKRKNREFFTEEQNKIIERLFSEEIRLFGYHS